MTEPVSTSTNQASSSVSISKAHDTGKFEGHWKRRLCWLKGEVLAWVGRSGAESGSGAGAFMGARGNATSVSSVAPTGPGLPAARRLAVTLRQARALRYAGRVGSGHSESAKGRFFAWSRARGSPLGRVAVRRGGCGMPLHPVPAELPDRRAQQSCGLTLPSGGLAVGGGARQAGVNRVARSAFTAPSGRRPAASAATCRTVSIA